MHTACVWSEKLPFAGYSVVKELPAFSYELPAFCAAIFVAATSYSTIWLRGTQARPKKPSCLSPGRTARPRERGGARGAPPSRKCRRHLPTNLGGEYRARTGDLLVANQALSQLS